MTKKYIVIFVFLSLVLVGITGIGWLVFRSIFLFADWSMKNVTDLDQIILSFVTAVVLLPFMLLFYLDRIKEKSLSHNKR